MVDSFLIELFNAPYQTRSFSWLYYIVLRDLCDFDDDSCVAVTFTRKPSITV